MQTIFSGIQPTGGLTLGNYLGALKRFVEMQENYNCYYCIVDLHALTVMPNPQELYEGTLDAAAIFYASGIDPSKSTLFIQSHVSEHSELAWLLQCMSYFGEMSRMTQFKDKSQLIERTNSDKSVTTGLFTYPTLMAADILLYDTDIVPVGEDQKQHVELTRDIAQRANQLFDDVFKVPKPVIPKIGGKIMSLRNPESKMSKSDPIEAAKINMLDKPDVIRKKVKRAVTDSDRFIKYDPVNKAGVSNLLTIESLCRNISIEKLEEKYDNEGYGFLKSEVAEAVVEVLEPIQKRYHEIRNSDQIKHNLKKAAAKAQKRAKETLTRYQNTVGLNIF
ncbi:MAG: tryptophan--tRNA ligase [Clostridia bacterium]